MGETKYPKRPTVSIIIPAYMQEKTIQEDIIRIKNVMDHVHYNYELIVVVDGKIDKTYENASLVKSSKIIVTGYKNNRGKGFAIRYGMMRSKGEIIGFIDSGMDINPHGLSLLLDDFIQHNADIIIGSKRHPLSRVNYPLNRKIISLLSQLFIMFLFGLNVKDTQVGLKFFKRKVIEDVLPRLLVKKFAFDIEILVVSYHLGYKKIVEAPIELNFNSTYSIVSKKLLREVFITFIDTLAIYYRLKLLQYYQDSNRRKWKYDHELHFKVNLP